MPPEIQKAIEDLKKRLGDTDEVREAFREGARVLKPGGRALILEFSQPTNPILKPLYIFYLRYLLPLIGGMLSGDRKAYSYLNKTIETFPSGPAFCSLWKMQDLCM